MKSRPSARPGHRGDQRQGQVGKTSIVANVGVLAAAAGYRVLLVDLDPQGNLADDFGYADTDADDRGAALHMAVASRQPAQPVRAFETTSTSCLGEQTEDPRPFSMRAPVATQTPHSKRSPRSLSRSPRTTT